jgi:hypothetical protein
MRLHICAVVVAAHDGGHRVPAGPAVGGIQPRIYVWTMKGIPLPFHNVGSLKVITTGPECEIVRGTEAVGRWISSCRTSSVVG